MPGGTFQGAGVKTVVLFFEKGAPTRKIWFYKLDAGRTFGKTSALNDADLEDFVSLQADFEDSDNSWSVDAKTIDAATCDLSVKNPNKAEEAACATRERLWRKSPRWTPRARRFWRAFGGCCEGVGGWETWGSLPSDKRARLEVPFGYRRVDCIEIRLDA